MNWFKLVWCRIEAAIEMQGCGFWAWCGVVSSKEQLTADTEE